MFRWKGFDACLRIFYFAGILAYSNYLTSSFCHSSTSANAKTQVLEECSAPRQNPAKAQKLRGGHANLQFLFNSPYFWVFDSVVPIVSTKLGLKSDFLV